MKTIKRFKLELCIYFCLVSLPGLALGLFLQGCGASSVTGLKPTVFYPPLPNPPRIQFLTTLSSARDLGKTRGSFAEFIAGKNPEEDASVVKPYGLAFHGGKLHVIDTRGFGYAIFDLKDRKYSFVRGSGGGVLKKPINITIDTNGFKYITDTGRNQIVVFDAKDYFVRAYGLEDEFKPGDVKILGNQLYLTDLKTNQILVLDKKTGEIINRMSKTGPRPGELFWPTNLAFGPNGNIYVSDTGNARLQVFDANGEYLHAIGSRGKNLGQFVRPKGVAIDRNGLIYVVDSAFQNVQIFNLSGQLLMHFGEGGGNPENLDLPTQIVIDYDHVSYFQQFADPNFKLEYVIAITNQFGPYKITVYGFGRMANMDYSVRDAKDSTGDQPGTE